MTEHAGGGSRLPDLLLIHGDEAHLVDVGSRRWLAAARAASFSDLDVEIVESPSRLDGVRASLGEVPFLADRRHLLLRDPPQLAERARRGADSADALATALEQRSPTTAVCLVAHQRVSATNPVLRFVARDGRVVEHPRLKGRDLRSWAERAAAGRGLRLPPGALDHLLRVAGQDLGVIDAELAKLAAFAEGRQLLLDDVRRLVAGSEAVEAWAILERLLVPPHGGGAAALDALLADGASTQQLTAVIAGQLRELLQAHEVLVRARGAGAIAAALGVAPWRAERLARWARVTTPDMVEGWLRALQHLDAETKQGRLDDAAALRTIILRAARQLAGTRAGQAEVAPAR